jgi:hypothetical protein
MDTEVAPLTPGTSTGVGEHVVASAALSTQADAVDPNCS